jgi:hypothetical protein
MTATLSQTDAQTAYLDALMAATSEHGEVLSPMVRLALAAQLVGRS